MRKNAFQKKQFSTRGNIWFYVLLIVGCSVLYRPVVSELKRTAFIKETGTVEETEFQRAMPFPLLPALEVSGLFHAKKK
jgi:hypothetical protein